MKNVVLSMLFLSTVGCATYKPAVQREIVKSQTVNKDFDKTWSSIVKVLADKNITFKSMDKASGLIATDVKSFEPFDNGGYIDCGSLSGPSLATNKGSVIYNIFVEKESTKQTKVTINLKPLMTSFANGVSMERECYSTGGFEKDFLSLIK